MIQNPTGIATYVLTLTVAAVISSDRAIGQEIEQCSRKELHRLVATARDSNDYRKLAEYFHQEKQAYRAKADAEMHEYAKSFSYYHPKFPTGAENAARLYEYYSGRADRAGELAAYYDDLLVRNGFKPISEPLTVSAVVRPPLEADRQAPKPSSHSASPQKPQTGFDTR